MTWTKLGDEFSDAAAGLSDAAFRLHVEALGWSNRRLLDLVVPKRDVRRFAETPDPAAAAAELVAASWWVDRGDAWHIGLRFPEWQRDRVQVEHQRERKARDQRRKRLHDVGDHSVCIVGRCPSLAPAVPPDPSPPPSPGDTSGDKRGDPGRVGTGRDGEDAKREEQEHARATCASCGRETDAKHLINGRCRRDACFHVASPGDLRVVKSDAS